MFSDIGIKSDIRDPKSYATYFRASKQSAFCEINLIRVLLQHNAELRTGWSITSGIKRILVWMCLPDP